MSDALVSWEEVQERLAMADGDHVAIEPLIDTASARANTYTGRKLAARVQTLVLDGPGSCKLILPDWPINSVTSVHVDPTRVWAPEYEVTDFVAYAETGILLRNSSWGTGRQTIRIIANLGYETVPDDLRESIIQLVAYWNGSPGIGWISAAESVRGGAYQTHYVGQLDLPFQVRTIWDSYRRYD
ncbi:MAG: hypothetical protein EA384_09100 [Spirochaetaceae bacterium]|nr:MAG: hypothetical protein EA384_09100 [Spirochaetaceae bacterium]